MRKPTSPWLSAPSAWGLLLFGFPFLLESLWPLPPLKGPPSLPATRDAIVICTFPGDYRYIPGYNVSPAVRDRVDVILVLAYYSEPLPPDLPPYMFVLVLEAFVPGHIIKEAYASKSHAAFKTFAALHFLSVDSALTGHVYDHIAVVDSEVQFQNFAGLSETFRAFFRRRMILGSDITDVMTIDLVRTSSTLLEVNASTREKMTASLANFAFYSWYSDLPVYKSAHIMEFLRLIGYSRQDFMARMSKSVFHQLSYNSYLIAFHGFSAVRVSDRGIKCDSSLEQCSAATFFAVQPFYPLMWIYGGSAAPSDPLFSRSLSQVIVTYHLDRNNRVC